MHKYSEKLKRQDMEVKLESVLLDVSIVVNKIDVRLLSSLGKDKYYRVNIRWEDKEAE